MKCIPAAITPISIPDILTAVLTSADGLRQFESNIAAYFSRKYVCTFSALMRTMFACFVTLKTLSPKTKVVLPRYSCPSFAHGVLAAGLEIEYCDINPQTLAIDMNSLSALNMNEVLAVVCTNLFGLTSAIDDIINYYWAPVFLQH